MLKRAAHSNYCDLNCERRGGENDRTNKQTSTKKEHRDQRRGRWYKENKAHNEQEQTDK